MKLFDFIFAARPLLHLPIWTVYLICLEATSVSEFPPFAVSNLLSIIALNLLFAGAFYYNQIEDEESDRVNNKLGFLQRGLISRKGMLTAFGVVSIGAIVLAALVSYWLLSVVSVLLLLSIIYSHPKIRLKDKPIGGLLANSLAHGGLVALAGFPVFGEGGIDSQAIYLSIYFSLTVGAVYVMTTIPDWEGDRATGKMTICVRYGEKKAITVAIILMALSVPIGWLTSVAGLPDLAGLSTGLFLWTIFQKSPKLILLCCKLPLLLLTLWAGAAYPVYLLFVIALVVLTRIYYKLRFKLVYPKLA